MVTTEGTGLDADTVELLSDPANLLYTSAVCVHELIYLLQSGKLEKDKGWRKGITVLNRIENVGIKIVPINVTHLTAEERLPLFERHKDPVDRLIVAQAIADRATL
ncbi:MAG: PIN domain-containing protein, partial [Prevotellaceae bacterium]|nr:PIN domain-containing protein [Prevotellaceae bacterium]